MQGKAAPLNENNWTSILFQVISAIATATAANYTTST